jgi:hypothetical protein
METSRYIGSARLPRETANLTGTHKWDLPGGNVFSASVNASYTSSMFNDVLNSPELERSALTLLGAALSFDSCDNHWNVTARGENPTNREFIWCG